MNRAEHAHCARRARPATLRKTTENGLHDTEHTLSTPMSALAGAEMALLCVTIVWHPDLARVGEQVCATGDTLELSRYLPCFQRPGQAGTPLAYSGVSRDCVRIVRDGADHLHIHPPSSRMVVELNGVTMQGAASLSREQVAAGAILGLGGAVLLCLHWMHCLPRANPVPGLIGVGGAAIALRDLIRQVAPSGAAVLLLGETGTGKDVVARAIHALSPRAARSLVAVNMATLGESLAAAELFGAARGAYTGAQGARGGLFGEAQQGTLFLDEIGNAPATVQPMLLRVLETGDYRPLGAGADCHSSARIIAATDQDLYADSFNQALLRRLESFVIQLPPLRTRREDIGPLLVDLLGAAACATVFPATLASRFLTYHWPGNIRQLRHVATRCLLALESGSAIDFDSLVDAVPASSAGPRQAPAAVQAAAAAPAAATAVKRRKPSELSEAELLAALNRNGWYLQGTAQALGISRTSLYQLLETQPAIRRPDRIAQHEIVQALARSGGDLEACAALLQTPTEALRRHLRGLTRA